MILKTFINKQFITLSAALVIAAGITTSCQSQKVEITDDLTSAQLIQRGQDAYAEGNYKKADAYYIATIDRFGEDLKCYVEARYELAHSFLSQKKYDEAKTMFNEIIRIYDSPDAVYKVQAKYKKLAQIGLKTIEDAENEQASKKR